MNFNLVTQVNIGELTDVKVKKIQDKFSGYFKNGVVMPGQLVMMGQSSQVILQENQIQCIFDESSIENIGEALSGIQDLLLLNEVFTEIILVASDVKESKVDTMEYSKEKFMSLIQNSIGLGIREFFIYKDMLCEFKVEPYISDKSKWYISAQYNLKNIDVNSIKCVLKDAFDDYNVKCKEINPKIS